MAVDAVWRYQGVGQPVNCRVILKEPDEIETFGAARIVSDTVMAAVRVSQVAAPKDGDRFDIGADRYRVQGAPMRDRERLVWTFEMVPA